MPITKAAVLPEPFLACAMRWSQFPSSFFFIMSPKAEPCILEGRGNFTSWIPCMIKGGILNLKESHFRVENSDLTSTRFLMV